MELEDTNMNIVLEILSELTKGYVEFLKVVIIDESLNEYFLTLTPFEVSENICVDIPYDNCPVKRMGFQLMGIDTEPSTFSLGLTMEFAHKLSSSFKDIVIYINACKTLQEIKDEIYSSNFKMEVLEHFEKAIKNQH